MSFLFGQNFDINELLLREEELQIFASKHGRVWYTQVKTFPAVTPVEVCVETAECFYRNISENYA